MSRGKDCALMLALIGLGVMSYKLKTQKPTMVMQNPLRPQPKPDDDDLSFLEDPRFSRFTKQRTSPDKQALQQVTQQMPSSQPARQKSLKELSDEAGDFLDADPKSLIGQTRSY